ncbi:hypothetical protein ES703_58283 [subsurface metagenome]
MNIKQKIVLWIGIAIIVIMGLFPPWIMPITRRYGMGNTVKYRKYYGYDFIWAQPESSLVSIDFHRLGLQWAIVGVITGGLIYSFKDKKPKDEQKQ